MILHHLITALFVRYLKEIIAMISLISCIELFLSKVIQIIVKVKMIMDRLRWRTISILPSPESEKILRSEADGVNTVQTAQHQILRVTDGVLVRRLV